MTDDIKILRAAHGSAIADGSEGSGRISFVLSRTPERRWLELFEASKGSSGLVTEERPREFLLHASCVPGQVAEKRDTALGLIADVNGRWRAEVNRQKALAREKDDNKRAIEEALNRELEALDFERV